MHGNLSLAGRNNKANSIHSGYTKGGNIVKDFNEVSLNQLSSYAIYTVCDSFALRTRHYMHYN